MYIEGLVIVTLFVKGSNENLERYKMEDVKTNEGTQDVNSTEGTEQTKTYTQEEVDALLQAETDRRVTSALKKQAEKNKAEMKEAEKIARMNESEKFQYELEQREKAIAAKEKELAMAEMKNEASKILSEKGISLSLVDFIVNSDAEVTKSNIDILDKAFKASVKSEVEKRLSSNAPKKNLPLDHTLTKEEFKKMGIVEIQKLKNENPELYNELIK